MLLRKADVNDCLPTPVDDIVAAAGLVESPDYVLTESKISQAPRELRSLLRSAARKIRGVLDRRERVIHVNPTLDVPAQRQFTRCHEVMHDVLPWQRELMVLGDTNRTLAADVGLLFEREANQGGAELLFQLDLLTRIARDYPTDISTPILLAQMFGASIHATIRHWVANSNRPICGLVLDTTALSHAPLTFRRYEAIESPTWTTTFGTKRFPSRIAATNHPFIASLRHGPIDTQWNFADSNGDATTLNVQSFCNTYRTFVLLWLPFRESFVARHRRKLILDVA